ncbi:uncharacterized protein [Aegilops tauschii subsp. strangulata]|uniref:uncharacterized protein n=1 Tax=Aegilops tauschii subsp. strangulata TaxID=200361 RepID=UPI003CC87778
MHGERPPARSPSAAAAPDVGGGLRVCVNIPGLNMAASQDLFCRVGSFLTTSFLLLFSFFAISAEANASLREQLGGTQTAFRAKEAEFDALVLERDRLVKRLADQEESHKAALKAVQDSEAALQAEYETEAASWAEARQSLISGYGQIEDLVDEYFPGYSTAANQVVEAHHEARRQAGVEIAPNARRSLEEHLLAIQARLQPAHRMLRRLQRVGAQVLAALWPGEAVPRTPSRTADWLEVAVGRFEAWKASAARSGTRRALEFVKAWYPELSLDQLATWRQEADEELEAVRPAIIQRASAIADYTDTSAFAPEVDDNGIAQPEEWFGLNPADGEDSAEEIDSSDEGEEEEGEDGEDAMSDGGATGQSQLDRASGNEALPPMGGVFKLC